MTRTTCLRLVSLDGRYQDITGVGVFVHLSGVPGMEKLAVTSIKIWIIR